MTRDKALPEGWERTSVNEVVRQQFSGAWGKEPESGGTTLPIVRNGDIDREGTIRVDLPLRDLSEREAAKATLQPGDVLVTTSGDLGKTAIWPIGRVAAASNFVRVFRCADSVVPPFLYNWLRSAAAQAVIDNAGRGNAIRNLPSSIWTELTIPIAPLSEQRRIVENIEALLTRADAARERLAKGPALLKRFRQSVFAAACSGKLTEEINGGSDGDLPSTWRAAKVGDIFDIISGEAFKKSEYSGEGLRLLQIANVGFGRTLWEQQNFLPRSYAKSHAKLMLADGDIVLALNRPILGDQLKVARVSATDQPAILYQRVARLRADADESAYAFCYLRSPMMREEVRQRLQGTDQPYLNTSLLPDIPFPLPPPHEQKEIVRRVSPPYSRWGDEMK